MKLIRWTVPILSFFCLTGTSAEEQSNASKAETKTPVVELKYRFVEGDEWYYSLSEKGTQTAITAGLTQTLINDSSQTKHYHIVQVEDDGSALVEVVFDRNRIDFTVKETREAADGKAKSRESKLAYDTAAKEAPPKGLEGIKKSVGKPFARFRMSAAGEISELEFLQATQTLKQTKQRKGLPIAFPDEPISIGKSWSEKTVIELQPDPQNNPQLKLAFTVQTIYQLQAFEDGIAEISLNTFVQPRLPNSLLRGKMMPYLPTGTILFDTRKGRIISRTESIDRRELGVGGPKTVLMLESRKEETSVDPEKQGLAN